MCIHLASLSRKKYVQIGRKHRPDLTEAAVKATEVSGSGSLLPGRGRGKLEATLEVSLKDQISRDSIIARFAIRCKQVSIGDLGLRDIEKGDPKGLASKPSSTTMPWTTLWGSMAASCTFLPAFSSKPSSPCSSLSNSFPCFHLILFSNKVLSTKSTPQTIRSTTSATPVTVAVTLRLPPFCEYTVTSVEMNPARAFVAPGRKILFSSQT